MGKKLLTWWDYVEDAVSKPKDGSYHLLPIAITSQAEGAIPSEGWATGQGKSTLAVGIGKEILTQFYGYHELVAEEYLKETIMGNWGDYRSVLEKGMYEHRVGVAIADDFDEWAGKHVSHNKAVQWAARDFFKKRPYLGILLAPMSHIGNMASAWRGVWMFEIKIYALGKYEVQYIKTKTNFRDPEKPYKILDKNTVPPLKGTFKKMTPDFQKWYDNWRDVNNKTQFKEGWEKHFGTNDDPSEIPEAMTSMNRFTKTVRGLGIKATDDKLRALYNDYIKPTVKLVTA